MKIIFKQNKKNNINLKVEIVSLNGDYSGIINFQKANFDLARKNIVVFKHNSAQENFYFCDVGK